MSTTPVQPSLPRYPISDLYLFANYADRAAYLAAAATQAPPFNPALPIKGWADPAPNGQPYLVFDDASGQALELSVPAAAAAALNLPGTYNYPAYVETSTAAQIVGPYGPISQVAANEVCLQSDAQAVANAIEPLYPGEAVMVADGSFIGIYHTVYGTDPRRQWIIEVAGVSLGWAQAWIEAQNAHGVGAPGHWALAPIPGDAVSTPFLQWIQDPQVTAAPADACTAPVPIRPLLPNEEFILVEPADPLFGTAQWMVRRTDMAPAITLVQVEQLVAQYNAQPGVIAIQLK